MFYLVNYNYHYIHTIVIMNKKFDYFSTINFKKNTGEEEAHLLITSWIYITVHPHLYYSTSPFNVKLINYYSLTMQENKKAI
jgi:hypothetical protein